VANWPGCEGGEGEREWEDGRKQNKNKNGPCKMEIKFFFLTFPPYGEGCQWVVGYRCGGFGDVVRLLVSGVSYPIRPGEEGSSDDVLRYGTGMWS